VNAVAAEIFDVAGDGEEDGSGAGGGGQAEGETELAVEIAAAEGGVVAVGEAKAGHGELVAEGAQDTGLADAWLAGERDGGALVEGLDQLVDECLFGRRQPQLRVGDLLRERCLAQVEVGEVAGAHQKSSSSSDW